MILVVCALPQELRYLDRRSGIDIFVCGVGPVESGIRVAARLAAQRYDAVVNAGIGGAFRGRAQIGDALLIVRDTFADFGLEGGGALALPPGTLVESATSDAALIARCSPTSLPLGRAITVTAVTATAATGTRLASRYDADVESMEGFAILRAAELAATPAIEVRGISNYVGERASSGWDFGAGARATADALERILDALLVR